MEWAGEIAGLLELTILRGGDLERVRHRSTVVSAIGQAARLAIGESPFRPRGRSQIERGERVDLARIRNRRDRSKDAVWLVDARAVVGLDAFQVQLHEADRRDLSAPDRALDAGDRRLFQMEPGSCPLGQAGYCEREDES